MLGFVFLPHLQYKDESVLAETEAVKWAGSMRNACMRMGVLRVP